MSGLPGVTAAHEPVRDTAGEAAQVIAEARGTVGGWMSTAYQHHDVLSAKFSGGPDVPCGCGCGEGS